MTLKGNECQPAAEDLVKLLKHPMPTVQQASLAVLETYSKPETFQPWIDGMPKADADTRLQSVRVFGQARLKAAVPAIRVALADPKAAVPLKFEGARALQRIGDGSVSVPCSAMPTPPSASPRSMPPAHSSWWTSGPRSCPCSRIPSGRCRVRRSQPRDSSGRSRGCSRSST
jgi:hypothetical protein